MSMSNSDWFNGEELSNCCGAPVWNPSDGDIGICQDCKEWCEVITQEEE